MDTAYVRESPPPKTAKHKVAYLNPLMRTGSLKKTTGQRSKPL